MRNATSATATQRLRSRENRHLVITAVTFKLPKNWVPNTSYKALAEEIEINSFPRTFPSGRLFLRDFAAPQKTSLAGEVRKRRKFLQESCRRQRDFYKSSSDQSFFSFYPLAGGRFKLSAAWLIDNAGLRGYRMGDVGVWEKQPLVLVNYGQATGEDIYAMAQDVRLRVKN